MPVKATLTKPAVSMIPWASVVEDTHNAIQIEVIRKELERFVEAKENGVAS